jgi:hypothetical protein
MAASSALVAAVLVIAGAHVAQAGDRACYAGTATTDGADGRHASHAIVVLRELDRGAAEIRTTHWTDEDNEATALHTYSHVDPKAGTFEFAGKATGKLDGPAWQWSGWHVTLPKPVGIAIDGQVHGDALVVTERFESGGKVTMTERWQATAFDCRELDKRRAALDPMSSPTAVRSCYAGTVTSTRTPQPRPAVIVQSVDRARVAVRTLFGVGNNLEVYAVDAAGKATFDGDKPATFTGKPGAWVGYRWSAPNQTVEGTLGGPHVTRKVVVSGGDAPMTLVVDADRFDCKDLDAKRAAIR